MTKDELQAYRDSIATCGCRQECSCDGWGCRSVVPLLDEIDRLQKAVYDGYQTQDEVCHEYAALKDEVERLRRGDFTPEEFQSLCHHRDEKPGCTRADFEAGCREYQRKLFGAGEPSSKA